jgi:glutamate formiminotransferase/glutamate formiminotransferase/formiminotetrahydrofolate cyclodeaminase
VSRASEWPEQASPLVGVPNFSEGRSERVIGALEATLSAQARVLNRHYDPQHNRSVFTLAAQHAKLIEALHAGAEHAVDLIDMRRYKGLHPHIGALDVCPVVWQHPELHDEAVKAAREVADRIGSLGIPIFFYGELASSLERKERAYFRHPTAGATMVTAREPLVAFNVELDTSNPEIARAIAADLRESGEDGLPGVRAIGLPREDGRTQVSINIHDPEAVPLAKVVGEVTRLAAEHGAKPLEAELVGLVPEVAVRDYPGDPPIRGFEPLRDVIENVLG